MAIKDIVVLLDDGSTSNERVNAAFYLAKIHSAKVTGVALATMKPVHARVDDDKAIARMGEKLANKLVQDFTDAAAEAGLSINTIIIFGDGPASALKMAHYARNADLVMLPQPNPSRDNFARLQELSRQVILHSGRPVFFMPYIGASKFPCDKAMIAWDGTPAVSRAVHDAIPLLAKATEVIILVVESKKQKETKKDVIVEGLAAHLANHGVTARILRINPRLIGVASVILNQIADNDIDLLVIGGHGTPTIKQKIFGTVTQSLLTSMLVPVLMSD